MAKKKDKDKDLREVEIKDDEAITYYLNFDEFQTEIMFSVMSPKPLTPKQWYSCLRSFVEDIEDGTVDINSLFDDGFSGVHH